MSERIETFKSHSVDRIIGDVSRLDNLRLAVGHAIVAAELAKVDLYQRVSSLNKEHKDKIGLGMILGTNEAFEFDENGAPHRRLPSDFDKSLGRSGIFMGLAVFERADLSHTDMIRLPWTADEDNIEVCLLIENDPTSSERTNVQDRTLIPSRKTEGSIVFYHPKPMFDTPIDQ